MDYTKTNSSSEAASRLEAIIKTATDGIIIIDEKGCMEMVNEAAAGLFEYEIEEMLGKNVSMLMPEPHLTKHDSYISNYLHTGHAKIIGIGREVTGKKKSGKIFPCRLSISEVELTGRRAFTGILHDLTKEKADEEKIRTLNAHLEKRVVQRTEELASAVNQLLSINQQLEHEINERMAAEHKLRGQEQELRKAYEKEKELNKLKSRFVSMASHEFRTPLSTILSSADLIEAYTKEEQQNKRERHTKRIKSAVANLTGILNDFLSLSRLEEGKMVMKTSEFNLHEFCCEIIEDVQGLLKTGQTIEHPEVDPAIFVTLDKKMLKNILYNLISNAIKYSSPGQPIECQVMITDNQLQLTVRDYGIGIPAEEQQHLFTRFFRAHNVENIQGTGLGLNIVKRYLEMMQGIINFESKEGEGTTFYVHLPLP